MGNQRLRILRGSSGLSARSLFRKAPILHDVFLRQKIGREFNRGKERGFLPRQLAIETSAFCNAKCIMCPAEAMSRAKGFMSLDLHREVVDKVGEWNAPITIISHAGLGEPLLDKTLCQKIRYEKKVIKDVQVAVYTNGSLLSEKMSQMLIAEGLDQLSISLNAFRKKTYESVVKLNYDRTILNIHKFLELNRTAGSPVKVHVSLIPTELHSHEEIKDFRRYWCKVADRVIVPPFIGWGGHFEQDENKKQWPCRYLWEVFQVDWDGTVKMCCEDFDSRYPLGHIGEKTPMELFNSPRMKKQRLSQVKGNFNWPEICRNCIESHEVARDFWKSAILAPAP